MYNYHWYKMFAQAKIAEARSAAAYDRLVLTAGGASRDAQRATRWPLAGLLRALASIFGRGRPILDGTFPATHAPHH